MKTLKFFIVILMLSLNIFAIKIETLEFTETFDEHNEKIIHIADTNELKDFEGQLNDLKITLLTSKVEIYIATTEGKAYLPTPKFEKSDVNLTAVKTLLNLILYKYTNISYSLKTVFPVKTDKLYLMLSPDVFRVGKLYGNCNQNRIFKNIKLLTTENIIILKLDRAKETEEKFDFETPLNKIEVDIINEIYFSPATQTRISTKMLSYQDQDPPSNTTFSPRFVLSPIPTVPPPPLPLQQTQISTKALSNQNRVSTPIFSRLDLPPIPSVPPPPLPSQQSQSSTRTMEIKARVKPKKKHSLLRYFSAEHLPDKKNQQKQL
jgi:hypothetical protein